MDQHRKKPPRRDQPGGHKQSGDPQRARWAGARDACLPHGGWRVGAPCAGADSRSWNTRPACSRARVTAGVGIGISGGRRGNDHCSYAGMSGGFGAWLSGGANRRTTEHIGAKFEPGKLAAAGSLELYAVLWRYVAPLANSLAGHAADFRDLAVRSKNGFDFFDHRRASSSCRANEGNHTCRGLVNHGRG